MEGTINKHATIYILFFVCVHSRAMAVVVAERIQYAYANTNPIFLIIIKRETSDLKDPRNYRDQELWMGSEASLLYCSLPLGPASGL